MTRKFCDRCEKQLPDGHRPRTYSLGDQPLPDGLSGGLPAVVLSIAAMKELDICGECMDIAAKALVSEAVALFSRERTPLPGMS